MPAGTHSAITVQSQSINLTAGYHSIEVDYCQLAGSAELSLKWKGPNDSAYAVSASYVGIATCQDCILMCLPFIVMLIALDARLVLPCAHGLIIFICVSVNLRAEHG